jgi:hypothetical protein
MITLASTSVDRLPRRTLTSVTRLFADGSALLFCLPLLLTTRKSDQSNDRFCANFRRGFQTKCSRQSPGAAPSGKSNSAVQPLLFAFRVQTGQTQQEWQPGRISRSQNPTLLSIASASLGASHIGRSHAQSLAVHIIADARAALLERRFPLQNSVPPSSPGLPHSALP